MNWRDRYRMSDKKRAAAIPVARFDGYLDGADEFPGDHFLIGDEQRGYSVHVWTMDRGSYRMHSHDDAFYFALVEYLLVCGALRFTSKDDVNAYAEAHGWISDKSAESPHDI